MGTPCSGQMPGLYIRKEVMMNYYETIFILNPDLSPEDDEKTRERMAEVVREQGGEIHVVDDWGVKRLAYEVKKHNRGHYVLMQFAGDVGVLNELQRNYRVNDGVIKYMSLRIDQKSLQAVQPKEVETSSETPTEPEKAGE